VSKGRPRTHRICTVEGCGLEHRARGFCRRHYNRYLGKVKAEARLRDELPPKWVYTIEVMGFYKIGHTADVRGRLNALSAAMPFEPRLMHAFESNRYWAAEKELHEMFQDKHVKGEWYALDEVDLERLRAFDPGSLWKETPHERALRLTHEADLWGQRRLARALKVKPEDLV
jgi:hypothetical protein